MAIGMGVMIGMLSGSDSADAFAAAIGRTIASVSLDKEANGGDGALIVRFTDGTGIELSDRGRSCCESRYITCDDNLASFAGAKLLGGSVREGRAEELEYEHHEIQFLVIDTTAGSITCETHNEHNGYYGGFWVQVSALDGQPAAGV